MSKFNPDKVLAKAREAETDDLLDRVTVFREELEPDAVEILEAELARRGVSPDDIAAHRRAWRHRVLRHPAGGVAKCSQCPRAAMGSSIDWHRLWGLIPLFKRTYFHCEKHAPRR
jgi:hypothetical protein